MGEVALDCPDGNTTAAPLYNIRGVSFVEGGDSVTGVGAQRIMYYFVDNDITTGPETKDGGKIYRRVGAEPAEPITSRGLLIENAEFFVSGSEALADDPGVALDQPIVTIVIDAQEVGDTTKTYTLQTSVTQRILDI